MNFLPSSAWLLLIKTGPLLSPSLYINEASNENVLGIAGTVIEKREENARNEERRQREKTAENHACAIGRSCHVFGQKVKQKTRKRLAGSLQRACMPFHGKVNKNLLYGRRGFVQRQRVV